MKQEFLKILRCPDCNSKLFFREHNDNGKHVEDGLLICQNCQRSYPVLNGIPRFVPDESYSASFGFQWSHFSKVQLDTHSGVPISKDRFFNYSGWSPEELKGKLVLDMGCGAGRFTEVALSCGADVVAVDYSAAVDVCRENLACHRRLEVVQADIYHLPFAQGMFDYVYCFGVLQHTPDPRKAFLTLPDQVKKGGKLVVDMYPKLIRNIFWSKYWLRPFTKRISHKRLFPIVQKIVKFLLPVSVCVGRIPLIGQKLKYAIPVVNYEGVYPLSKSQLQEWSVLDTFDMLSPAHDHPQTRKALEAWFKEACMKESEVFRTGFFVGRGVK